MADQNLLARLINSASPSEQQRQKINSLLGLLEIGANVGTSGLAGLGGGLSYLGALPAGNDAAQHVKRQVENSLTYQPRTDQANSLLQLLAQGAAPFVKSGTVGAQTFADNVYNATGSPLLGAAARTAPAAIEAGADRLRLGAIGRNKINAADDPYVSWGLDEDPIFDIDGNEIGVDEYVGISRVYVPPYQRGKGVATKMLRESLKEIQEKYPGKPVRLAALPFDKGSEGVLDMDELVSFYEKEGFDVINTDGSAVIMQFDGRIRQ